MKINISLGLVLTFFCLFISCSGEFEPRTDSYITLSAPIDKCEGRNDELNINNIIADFSWSNNNGEFEKGYLIVEETATNTEVVKKEIETSLEKTEVSLPRGIAFRWYIKSKLVASNDSIPSDVQEFVSEFVTNEETPFPVEIYNSKQTLESFIIQWRNHPDEKNNDLTYKVYFSQRVDNDVYIPYSELKFTEPSINYNSGDILERVQPKNGLMAGYYFFRIDAITQSGGDLLISSSYDRVPLASDN